MPDQAAGLRARARPDPPEPGPTLMVVGLPPDAAAVAMHRRLHINLPLLASQQRRWALWVDSDADAFRRAYRTLKILRRHPGPSRLLALHAPGLPRAGLLSNLQHGARHFLDIELVVLSP